MDRWNFIYILNSHYYFTTIMMAIINIQEITILVSMWRKVNPKYTVSKNLV